MTDNCTIEIKVKNNKHLKQLFRAEKEMRKAGITFDSGYDTRSKTREWHVDWSLKGAKIKCHES